MRGGITCVKCNKSIASLKFFQPVKDKNRCPSCGLIGSLMAGEDKRMYLVTNKENLPKGFVRSTERKENSAVNVQPVDNTAQKRDRTINRIIHLVDILNIKKFSGWEDVNFEDIKSLRVQKEFSVEELLILLEELERIYDKRMAAPKQDDYLLTVDLSERNWRRKIPEVIKETFDDWNRVSIGIVELYAKDMMKSTRGRDKKEVQEFLDFISELLKERKTDDLLGLVEDDYEHQSLFEEEKFEETELEKWQELAPEQVKESFDRWETLSIKELQQEVLNLISFTKNRKARNELEDYVGILDDMLLVEEDLLDEDMGGEEVTYDPLAVIDKYKYGSITKNKNSTVFKIDDSWRKLVPGSLKYHIKDWRTASIQSVYDQAKEIMGQSSGTARQELIPFVVELSQIIFDSVDDVDEEIEVDEDSFSKDEASEAVMSLVEMIILPHLEVMDIIRNRGGNITFSNLWYKPFTDKLKEEVKDRDEWRCVICEAETDLHVHHKIPREKGGIHHRDNLVTLCASCHGAVETADVQLAFKKCLANYNRKKFSNISRETLSMDKKLLREEVETKLDILLVELNKRDENKLIDEVVGIMKRLEILFYD